MSGQRIRTEDVRGLFNLLRSRGWRTAREIVGCSSFNSRTIRAICSEHPAVFLSTQAGYKLVRDATDDEIGNGIADLCSRIQSLAQRAEALQQVIRNRHQAELGLGPTVSDIVGLAAEERDDGSKNSRPRIRRRSRKNDRRRF